MQTLNRPATYSLDFSGHYLYHRHLGVTDIADNGERDDQFVSLHVAVGGHKSADDTLGILYLSTNGDPVVVATAIAERHDSRFEDLDWICSDEVDGWIRDESQAWLVEALKPYGLSFE
jgi:hypothetical protein